MLSHIPLPRVPLVVQQCPGRLHFRVLTMVLIQALVVRVIWPWVTSRALPPFCLARRSHCSRLAYWLSAERTLTRVV